MKKYFLLIAMMMGAMVNTMAQSVVANDTLYVTVDSISHQPDPNKGEYGVEFFGMDSNGKRQKVAIRYESESEFGTFSNSDFYNWNGEHGSGSYNFIREQNNSDKFFSFTEELTVSVTDSLGAIVYDLNGIYKYFGRTRVLLHAVIPAPVPDDTVSVDLGVVSVIPNAFLQYIELHAANSEYSLATGIMGRRALAAGTYYMADLLRPELVTADGDTIMPASAELTITTADAGQLDLVMSLLDEDNVLYLLSMHTGTVEITDTVVVNCASGQVIYNQIYDMFQFQGQSAEYVAVLSVSPGVLTNDSVVDVPVDSIQLTMTSVIDLTDSSMVHIFDAHATVTVDPSNTRHTIVSATMLGVNGVCYEVTIPIGFSIMPEAKDTVTVDCGEGVIRVDYTRGIGMVGLVLSHQVGEEVRSANVVFYTGAGLGGWYENEDFDYEANNAMYVQRVWVDDSGPNDTIRTYTSFITVAQMQIDSINDTIHISLDAYAHNDTLYHFTAWMSPKQALTGDEHDYSVTTNDDCAMIGIRYSTESENQYVYELGIQRAVLDAEGEIDGNAEIWNFLVLQTDWDGIQGEYGYSDGNMDDTQYHVIYEGGTEIYLAPVAGTLHITAMQQMSLMLPGMGIYRLWLYAVNAKILAENGQFYNVTGQTYMFCIDGVTEQMVELTEDVLTAIDEVLSEQGLRVKKVLRNGMILLESADHAYTISGQLVR